MNSPIRYLLALSLLLLAGCGEDLTPEQEVRNRIAEMETIAEARKGLEFVTTISQDYEDKGGRTAKEVRRMALGYLMANQSVHLLVRIRSVVVESPERAEAVVLVAMLGQQESEDLALPLIRANLYRFRVAFRKELGFWNVIDAEWRHATKEDLIE